MPTSRKNKISMEEKASKMIAELFIAQIDEKNKKLKINKNYKIRKYENTNT